MSEESCCICLEPLTKGDLITTYHDAHRVHSVCAAQWTSTQRNKNQKPVCPLCLKTLEDNESATESENDCYIVCQFCGNQWDGNAQCDCGGGPDNSECSDNAREEILSREPITQPPSPKSVDDDEKEVVAAIEKDELENHADFVVLSDEEVEEEGSSSEDEEYEDNSDEWTSEEEKDRPLKKRKLAQLIEKPQCKHCKKDLKEGSLYFYDSKVFCNKQCKEMWLLS